MISTEIEPAARGAEILARCEQAGVLVRLFGGLGVSALLGDRLPESCRRTPGDIDLVARRESRRTLSGILEECGFAADRQFNALHGAERLLFEDDRGLKVDVVLDNFRMCHILDLSAGLTCAGPALTAPLLLLTKLQIVQLTHKDRLDVQAMLAALDPEELGVPEIARLCAADWGLWRTVSGSLASLTANVPLTPLESRRLESNRKLLIDALQEAPKGMRWRARARVGDRVRWYELPEAP